MILQPVKNVLFKFTAGLPNKKLNVPYCEFRPKVKKNKQKHFNLF